jgi:hypothetical protein
MLSCFWFTTGVVIYLYLLNGSVGNYLKVTVLNRFNFFELSFILFTIYCLISGLIQLIVFNLLDLVQIGDLVYYNHDAGGEVNSSISFSTSNLGSNEVSSINNLNDTNSPTISSNISGSNNIGVQAADGAIMTTALAGGLKLAHKIPTLALKSALATGSVALGGTAIGVKNVIGNVTSNIGKNSYLPKDIDAYISEIYNLTGNSFLDLLILIQVFQKLQLLFIFLICYNSILLLINESKLEIFLLRIFPIKIVNIYMKSLRLLKKSGFIIIICLVILLIISNLYSYYCLNFFLSNLEHLVDLYINYKKN